MVEAVLIALQRNPLMSVVPVSGVPQALQTQILAVFARAVQQVLPIGKQVKRLAQAALQGFILQAMVLAVRTAQGVLILLQAQVLV